MASVGGSTAKPDLRDGAMGDDWLEPIKWKGLHYLYVKMTRG
jgi:hypothetical protein